jgi:hypothetical protein
LAKNQSDQQRVPNSAAGLNSMIPEADIAEARRSLMSFRGRVLPWILWGIQFALMAGAIIIVQRTFLRSTTGDFYHFYEAAVAMTKGQDIYTSGRFGYIYPPLIAFAFQPLAAFSEIGAAWVWFFISLTLLGLTIYFFVDEICRRFNAPRDALTTGAIALLGVLLTIDKLRWGFDLGQTDTILMLCFVLSLRWLDTRPILAGIMLGLAANVKYLSLIMLPYLIVRGRWKAAGSTLASFAGFMLLPAISAGWETNLGYIRVALGGMGRMLGGAATPGGGVGEAGEAANISDITWGRSVSVTSALHRLFDGGLMVPIALAVICLALLALGAWMYRYYGFALWRSGTAVAESRTPRRALVGIEWIGLIVAALAFSPQTTTRHMAMLLFAHLLAALVLLVPRRGVKRWPVLLAVVLMVLALNLPPGHKPFYAGVEWWRMVGGAGWTSIVMLMLLIWTSLRYARAVSEARPLDDPPPGHLADGSRVN